ncbi:TetR/AcrR family transcriptional regulator [Candidatus Arthromitus sp. SFB-rat-Yit]|uniref:TetR/AcrR family transcriptional regulator n=1 Tax=Candidatus Arthromitus sp. SFB-rat-Yit TaxID=1041504 RepID=UPI000227A05C|nr:TetR/AcrR family transcriptional regulator [Candidatus Arthromitus sp. SFB-rat-Yit]BAK80736.1 hypothetical protein RATSFB_0174 [Candidatus Arthromitus sp. SFB-rat-Yit]
MPKSVLCDKKEICERVKNLFLVNGYSGVDIKTIAQKCKMAVGTFYNYYENKEEIFCEVISNSWNLFLQTLKKRNDLSSFIKESYYYIKSNKGFGLTFKTIPIDKATNVNRLYENIISDVELLIVKVIDVKYKDIAKRIALSLFMSIILFIDSYEFSDDDNIKFICNLFLHYEK